MPELLFITDDQRVLALVKNLRSLVEAKIEVATDFSQGLREVFDRHPAVVFIQREIGGVPGEKLASQARTLLDDVPISFVVLFDGPADLKSASTHFDDGLDVCLPLDELTWQAQQFVNTLPGFGQKTPGAVHAGEATSRGADLPSESPIPADSEEMVSIPDPPRRTATPPGAGTTPADQREMVSFPDVFPYYVPAHDDGFTDTEHGMLSGESGVDMTGETPAPADDAADTALPNYMPPILDNSAELLLVAPQGEEETRGAERTSEPADVPANDFMPDFFDNLLAQDVPTLIVEHALSHEPSNAAAPAVEKAGSGKERTVTDFRRVEKETPTSLFDSMSDAGPGDGSFRHPKAGNVSASEGSEVSSETAIKLATLAALGVDNASADTVTPRPNRQQPPFAARSSRIRHETVTTGHLRGRQHFASNRAVTHRRFTFSVIAALSIVTIIIIGLWYHDLATPRITALPATAPAKGTPPTPIQTRSRQELPKFIPRGNLDQTYASAHPGWERYKADAREYLVYRESGVVKAIQVIAEEQGEITVPFLKACIRDATGREDYTSQLRETRADFQVEKGALQNKGEVAIYRKMPAGDIRGFVITFP